jgi:hypothetical protein
VDNISTPLDISALASPPPIGNTTPNTGAFTTLSASGAVTLTGLGAMKLNAGTTAERPTPSNGMIRYNTTTPSLEGYVNGAWANIPSGSVVSSVATGTGLTGGPITSTGTIAIDSTVVTLTGTQTLTNKTIQGGAITSGSAVSVSGAVVDFTSIPSWVKRVTIAMQSISTNGTSNIVLRIGNTTFTTSGYVSLLNYVGVSANTSGGDTNSSGFGLTTSTSASGSFSAIATIVLQTSGVYVFSYTGINTGTVGYFGAGYLNLGSTLDRIRLTTISGSDTFDAGTINILYE